MTPNLYSSLADLSGRIVAQSIDLLGAVASEPFRGVRFAQRAGVTIETFPDEDLRGLWCALEHAGDKRMSRLAAAKLCRSLLRSMGWWNPQGPLGGVGCMWNDERLAELFESYPGPSAVPNRASVLLATVSLRASACRLANELFDVLDRGEPPPPRIKSAVPVAKTNRPVGTGRAA